MKVQITSKVTVFQLKGKKYYPGDIAEIEERQFCPDFMLKVVETQTGELKAVEEQKPAETMVRRQVRQLPKESP